VRVYLYARVSTGDKDQDPETQLIALRDYCRLRGWEIVGEFVDHAPARDLLHRTEWRRMQKELARRPGGLVLVFKLDRAFRSVKDMHDHLAAWQLINVGFQSVRENFDTTTALGRLLMNILASFAEFELETIRERVIAGMDRAKRQGRHIGRPRATDKWGAGPKFARAAATVAAGTPIRQAAREFGVNVSTLRRYLAAQQGTV